MSHQKHNNFKFKHSLGQNFITDEFLLEDIADESGITKDDYVLEIGPGNGALTRCLCDRAKYVVAVEIDKSLIPLLTSNLKEYKNVSGLVIGLTLTLVHLVGIYFTGTSVNPARSLGPALLQGGKALEQVWVFLVAPLLGSALAALFYKFVLKEE